MMRGYLNFLLVFISVFFILSLIISSSHSNDVSFSKAIAAERNYQIQMNFKEVAIESIRLGAKEGFSIYNRTHDINKCDPMLGGPAHPGCFRIEEARLFAAAGAYLRLSALDAGLFDPVHETEFFCSDSFSDDLALSMMPGADASCTGCEGFTGFSRNVSEFAGSLVSEADSENGIPDLSSGTWPYCMGAIYPRIVEDPGNAALPAGFKKNPGLGSIQISRYIISIARSERLGVSSAAYIGPGIEVDMP